MLQQLIDSKDCKPQFSGHETFPIRYGWLHKVVSAFENSGEENIFDPDVAMILFGVGKNMVVSMRHWSKAVGVLDEKDQLTEFGRQLLSENGWDPYLENL